MKTSIIVILFVSISFNSFTQTRDKLKVIAKELSNYSTYQTNCNYTFSMPFGGTTLNYEALIVTQQIPTDTLADCYYNFSTKEEYRNENFNDFSMYFKNAVYSSYKGKVKKTKFEEKPKAFTDLKIGEGFRPAIQRSPQLYYITPYQIAQRIDEIIEEKNSKIVQMPDTIISNEVCIKFFITTITSSASNILELCFHKKHGYPIFYRNDSESKVGKQFRMAYFTDTKVNVSLPENYFSETNLLPSNWQNVDIPSVNKTPDNLIGDKAPNWNLPVLNSNNYLSNSDFKGKYILLEFTATWCAHCIRAAEMMNRLEEQFGDNEKVAILSIYSSNIDKKEVVENFADKQKLKSTILYSASEVGEKYQVYSYPNFIVVSPEGKVFMNFPGYSEGVEKNIINVLSELTK